MYIFFVIKEYYQKISKILSSLCYVENNELEEALLSKCENDVTNEIIYKIDRNSYVIDHTKDNLYTPPFSLNTIPEEDVYMKM